MALGRENIVIRQGRGVGVQQVEYLVVSDRKKLSIVSSRAPACIDTKKCLSLPVNCSAWPGNDCVVARCTTCNAALPLILGAPIFFLVSIYLPPECLPRCSFSISISSTAAQLCSKVLLDSCQAHLRAHLFMSVAGGMQSQSLP